MKSEILSLVFADFCETRTHFDSILSKVHPHQRPKVARYLGAFLRRPLTLAKNFGITLEATPEEFWALSFIKLKKHEGIHQLLGAIWEHGGEMPNEGSLIDFPPSLVQSWVDDWGQESAAQMARLLSQEPLTTIRAHRRARDLEKDEGMNWLNTFDVKARVGYYSPVARVFKGFAVVQKNPLFEQGYFEIQDEGSQIMAAFALKPESVAPMLSAQPSSKRAQFSPVDLISEIKTLGPLTVIDACAGAGGKTLALADLLEGQGRVYGYDVFEKKVSRLKERADRAQERNIQGVLVNREPGDQLTNFDQSADRVLIDSPCSGLGVLRRNPDIKWNRKPATSEQLESQIPLVDLQKLVVQNYAPLVKVGGILTYGVCTFSKSESIDQVRWIEKSFPGFKLEYSGFIGPHETDGFFMASFRRQR